MSYSRINFQKRIWLGMSTRLTVSVGWQTIARSLLASPHVEAIWSMTSQVAPTMWFSTLEYGQFPWANI